GFGALAETNLEAVEESVRVVKKKSSLRRGAATSTRGRVSPERGARGVGSSFFHRDPSLLL
ncbi:MAG TPA: hypothetical protein VF551_05345, partial [Chthoniobacterales bacterium]